MDLGFQKAPQPLQPIAPTSTAKGSQRPGHRAEGPQAQELTGLHLLIYIPIGLIHSSSLPPGKNCGTSEAHPYWPTLGRSLTQPRRKQEGVPAWPHLSLRTACTQSQGRCPLPPSATTSDSFGRWLLTLLCPLCSGRTGLPPPSGLGEEGQLTLKVCFRLMLSEGCTAATRKLRRGMLPRMLSSFSSARKQRPR